MWRSCENCQIEFFSCFVVQDEPNFPAVQGEPAYRKHPASGRDSRVQVKVRHFPAYVITHDIPRESPE